MGPLTSISFSRPMASNDSRTLGSDMSTWKDFPFAILTTSLQARKRPIVQRIASHCLDCDHFAIIGSDNPLNNDRLGAVVVIGCIECSAQTQRNHVTAIG